MSKRIHHIHTSSQLSLSLKKPHNENINSKSQKSNVCHLLSVIWYFLNLIKNIGNQIVIKNVVGVILLLSAMSMQAQLKPVSSSVQFSPPYTTKYANFLSPISNSIKSTITLNDLSEPSIDIRLHLTIEGEGVTLETKENFVPLKRFTLTAGIPLTIEGADIVEYFNPNNLEFSGISRQNFVNQGRFEEGNYTFTIEAVEYNSGKVISNAGMAVVWLKLNDEPTMILPQMESVLEINGTQNIQFQWQLNTPTAVGTPFVPNYKFFLYEVMESEQDPLYAFNNGKTILVYESENLLTTSLLYGPAHPILDVGKRYAYRVQAFDPSGENEFRNDGYSPFSWVYYGYPENGVIDLASPSQGRLFRKNDSRTFTWKAPDNLLEGQHYEFTLKIITLEGKDEDYIPEQTEMDFSAAWYQKSYTTKTRNQWTEEVPTFTTDKLYAWQVTAKTGKQTIAASPIQTFKGPLSVDLVRIGQHWLYITSLENADLNNLKGKGKIKLFESDTDSSLTKVDFEGLQVYNKNGGLFRLSEGAIEQDITDGVSFPIKPRNNENESSLFVPTKVKLDKKGLYVQGNAAWTFPHPVKGSSELVKITSESSGWLNFDRYKPFGRLKLVHEGLLELIDPDGFAVAIDPSSDILLYEDEYEIKLDGTIYFPTQVRSASGERVHVDFKRKEQFYYIEQDNYPLSEALSPIENVRLSLTTDAYIFDLSSLKSPNNIQDKDWKGFYFKYHDLNLEKDLDSKNQIKLTQTITENIVQNNANNRCYIDGGGLQFYWEKDFKEERVGRFNTFKSKVNVLKIEIEDNHVKESSFTGSISLPVIDPSLDYFYTVPLEENGFASGYLNQSLENQFFVYNPYGGENKINMTIKRAVFENQDHLDLVVDIQIPALANHKLQNIKDFHVYGDDYIGFKERNGSYKLPDRPIVDYNGYPLSLLEIGAALHKGDYVFSYQCEMKMGEGFTGENDKTPFFFVHSFMPVSEEIKQISLAKRIPPMLPIEDRPLDLDQKKLYAEKFTIKYEDEVVKFESEVELRRDDPDWGDVFRGMVAGELKVPGSIRVGGSFTFGNKGFDYFYLDAYYVDELGTGVVLFPGVASIVGAEGWIYHHMDVVDGQIKLDQQNKIGFNLFGQFTDTQKGAKYQLDGAMSFTSKTKDLKITGDASFINTNLRSPGGDAKKQAMEHAAKTVAKEALKALGGIDETITIGGVNVRLQLTESSGAIGLAQNGFDVKVLGDIAATPLAGLDFSKGQTALQLRADVRGSGSVNFKQGDLSSRISYFPNTGGAFGLSYQNYTLDADANTQTQKGNLTFKLGDNGTTIARADALNETGYFEFSNGDADFRMLGDAKNQKGSLFLETGGHSLDLSADAKLEKGNGRFVYDAPEGEISLGVGLNKAEGNASLSFSYPEYEADVFADKSGIIKLDSKIQEQKVYIEGDVTTQKGKMRALIEGDSASGWLDAIDRAGGIMYSNDDFYVSAEGNHSRKSGKIHFEQDDLRIKAAADPKELTGNIDLLVEGNEVKGNFTVEQQDLYINTQGVLLSAFNDYDSTALTITKDDVLFSVGGQPEDKKGFVWLKEAENELFLKANQPEKTGEFRMSYDNIKAGAAVTPSLKSANFAMDDLSMEAWVAGTDSGMISLVEQENQYKIRVSKEGQNHLNCLLYTSPSPRDA